MQTMDTNWQIWEQPAGPAAFGLDKESKLKLSLETRNHGDVIIVHCQGRIVYRDEAAALSRLVGEVLQHTSKLVLDLSWGEFDGQRRHRRVGAAANLGAGQERGT